MNIHQASVLNKLTEKAGPGWTILALVIMYRWSIATVIGAPLTALITTKAIGMW